VYAQKVCDVAVAEAGIVDRVAGYLNLQIAAVWNGTSTALPSSGNLPAATANATTATAVKAESEALNAAPAGTSGTSGTPKTLNDQILSGSVLTLPLPLGDITLPNLIARVITQVLSIVGALALLFFVWGGVTWMLASGDAKKIEDAKKIIIAAVSGLAAIFLSYAILNFILNAISSKV
jgi:hypothetical protein